MLKHCFRSLVPGLILATSVAIAATPAADDTAVTIYSSAQPGAIAPALYRPVPGRGTPSGMSVPGYALVRTDRNVQLPRAARSCASRTWPA